MSAALKRNTVADWRDRFVSAPPRDPAHSA